MSKRGYREQDFLLRSAIMGQLRRFEGPTAMLHAFTDHPQSVGETYVEHMGSAWGFAGTLLVAALCCFLHGLFPFAFQKSGSRRIVALHQRMVTNRHRHAPPAGVFGWAEGI